MEKIVMFKCSDGHTFESEDDAKEHDKKLKIASEVTEYLTSYKMSAHTQSSQKDIFVNHWESLKKYFAIESDTQKEIFDKCMYG